MAESKSYQQMIANLLVELQDLTVATMVNSGVESNSDLVKSIKYVEVKGGIDMVAAYYYPYVSNGRRAGIRKVPISALIQYIKDYGIRPRPGQTINQMAFAMQTAIYNRGIRAKNFGDKVVDVAGETTQVAVADELAITIADDLVDMFQPLTK
jgi:hypothetical protein